jgi:hypothetical protein
MFTGQTNPLIGVQAVASDGTAKTPYYVQAIASNDTLCIGPTSAKALKLDTNGNMTSSATLTVDNGIKVGAAAGQAPTTSTLRNSKLVNATTNPTVNGEICWQYE